MIMLADLQFSSRGRFTGEHTAQPVALADPLYLNYKTAYEDESVILLGKVLK
jgi:hypothetical protein